MAQSKAEQFAHWIVGTCAILVVRFLSPVVALFSGSGRPVRSVWSGTPILTLATKARGERLLGVEATSLIVDSNFITHDFDIDLSKFTKRRSSRALLRYAVFVWCCLRYDRFHFFMDRGFFQQAQRGVFNERELATYTKLGKQVFLYAYGADVRTQNQTKMLGEPNCCTQCPSPGSICVCDQIAANQNIQTIRRYATAYFSMGDMLEYTPGSYNELFYWPIDLSGEKYTFMPPLVQSDAPIRIVHAPNHRAFKGTDEIIRVVTQLKEEGVGVELLLVEKVPNQEALRIYQSADIIIDQCIIGFHGYFALEGMAMGKPVVCFIRKPDLYLLNHTECPIVNTSTSTLHQDLLALSNNRQRLHTLGIQSREYIEKHFTVKAFSERLQTAYKQLGVQP